MSSSAHRPWQQPSTPPPPMIAQDLFPESGRGEGKEKIQPACFLNGEFFSPRQWLTSAPLRSPLLLSLCALPRSIFAFWAETRGTSCSARRASQEFTSCLLALVSSATDSIPRTCVNGARLRARGGGRGGGERREKRKKKKTRQANASLFYVRAAKPPAAVCLHVKRYIFSKLCAVCVPLSCWAIIFALPSGDSKNTLCYFSDGTGEKEGAEFYSNQKTIFPRPTSVCSVHDFFVTPTTRPVKVHAVGNVSPQSPKTPSCLASRILVCMFSLSLTII